MYIVRQLLNDGSWRSLIIMVAILVGWWFLCKISEIIAFRIGNVKFYDASGDKLDIDKDDLSTAVEVDLIFGVTKNDVDGEWIVSGAIRTHSKVLSILCVVSGLAKMVTYRRDQAAKKSMNLDPMSPPFKFVDDSKDSGSEKQLTRNTIVRVLKAAASAAEIPEDKISCHSLRSGGATQSPLHCSPLPQRALQVASTQSLLHCSFLPDQRALQVGSLSWPTHSLLANSSTRHRSTTSTL